MRVVVAGGTGFIGRALVARLLADDPSRRVVVTSRETTGRPEWRGRVEVVQAFAGDRLSLRRAFMRADVVVQAVQFPNHPVEDPAQGHTYGEVDGRGTEVAVDAAQAMGVRRFVYVSGAGAGRGRPEPWFRAKDRAETACRTGGMELAIARPSWVYGPGDRSLSRIVWFCRHLPLIPVIGDGSTPVYPLHVADLARALAILVAHPDMHEETLDLGGPERLTMDGVVRTVQRVIGRRRPIVHHPAPFMRLIARGLCRLPHPILSPGAVDFLTQSIEIDPTPAIARLGISFRSLEDGLRGDLASAGHGTSSRSGPQAV